MTYKRQGIIFDLDDTLVDTSDVYWQARTLFTSILTARGMNVEEATEAFEAVDTEMIAIHGHTPERYGLSMRESYSRLVQSGRMTNDPSIETALRAAANIVPVTIPSIIDGAIELLEWTSTRFEMALLTRGVTELQTKKIEKWGLKKYFKSISIVSKKGSPEFLQSAKALQLEPQQCWALGDSIRSDINPALQAGIKAILVQYTHHSYHWQQEYGSAPSGPYYKVHRLLDVVPILQAPNSHTMEESLMPLSRDSALHK